jgi:3-deoxy-7-phosphoheptulonate synthase
MRKTHYLRVVDIAPLVTPEELKSEIPINKDAADFVFRSRERIESILDGRDRRLLAILGPCSIHDPKAAVEYAERLARLRDEVEGQLLVCMRVYFEKPRTTVGWKGLINDPNLDGSRDVSTGLKRARQLLLDLAEMGMPTATEMLDPISPQYISDLVGWTAVGARTTESQTHREMASGLSMPVGFKNGTDGGLSVAINAMRAARQAHSFIGIDEHGRVSVIRTTGNNYCHVVLRGGSSGPNYGPEQVAAAVDALKDTALNERVLIDCSHANSEKNYRNQPKVMADVARQIAEGSTHILGVMVESNLVAGRQDLSPWSSNLVYGQSITDACIDIDTTETAVRQFSETVAGAI